MESFRCLHFLLFQEIQGAGLCVTPNLLAYGANVSVAKGYSFPIPKEIVFRHMQYLAQYQRFDTLAFKYYYARHTKWAYNSLAVTH